MERSRADLKRQETSEIQQNFAHPDCYPAYNTRNRKEMLKYALSGTVILFVFSYVFYGSLIPGIVVWIPFLKIYIKRKRKEVEQRRLQKFRKEFKETIVQMSSLLNAGYSVENSMKEVSAQLKEVWIEETDMMRALKTMLYQMELSEPVEVVWKQFGENSPISEIKEFSEIFTLGKRNGVSLPAVIYRVVSQMNQKMQVEEQIETQITGRKTEQKIMNFMPAGILLYLCLTAPEMLEVMYTTWIGRAVMTVCLLVYLAAFYLASSVTEKVTKRLS